MDDQTQQGCVIWITGLSAAGKTTLARALQKRLAHSIFLDGDEMREALALVQGGFDKKSRKNLGFTYARWAGLLAKQGFQVIVATISLYHDLHTWNRKNLPHYIEVFLDISEDTRRQRDPKGLYKKEKNGLIGQMAGLQTNVEFPLNPDFYFNEDNSTEDCLRFILQKLNIYK